MRRIAIALLALTLTACSMFERGQECDPTKQNCETEQEN